MTPFISGASRMSLPKPFASAALAACLLYAHGALAIGGDFDSTFGNAGKTTLLVGANTVRHLVAAGPGGTTVAVRVGATSVDVQRFLDNGQADPSFGTSGTVALSSPAILPFAVAVQADGRVVLGGVPASSVAWGFMRLTAAGTIESTFGSGGTTIVPPGTGLGLDSMALQVLDDGRIVAVAFPIDNNAGPGANSGHATVLRLKSDGQPDATFGNGGVVDNAFGYAWTTQPVASERMLASGAVELARLTSDANVAVSRLRPDGSVDTSIGSGSMRVTAPPFSLAADQSPALQMLADGSLIVASIPFDIVLLGSDLQVARLSPLGVLDTSFGLGGIAGAHLPPMFLGPIAATPDGEIVVLLSRRDDNGFQALKLGYGARVDTRFDRPTTAPLYRATGAVMRVDGFAVILAETTTSVSLDGALYRMQAVGDIVEFYNSILDHYFMALDGTEAAGIDAGAAGPGWSRTHAAIAPGGLAPVCRFYGTPGIGPNSHFYTAQSAECALVKKDPGWTYEGTGFYTTRIESSAGCAAGLVPVHRLYNDGFAHGIDSNHRYVTELGLINLMKSRGWIYEGVVFCAKP
jgi:uncharacterized delta-60 repeat protein